MVGSEPEAGLTSWPSKVRGRWRCEACEKLTPPVFGVFIAGARHRCRTCGRTVCSTCSTVPLGGERICQACYVRVAAAEHGAVQREKYVFLVRHAQSTWNRNVELVKTLPNITRSLPSSASFKDVVRQATNLMARELWERDHPISPEGVRQTGELRQKILGARRQFETEREQRFYDVFLRRPKQVYCSPLLRALQTAHLVLPEEDGWGSIKLLKDARERFSFVFERDCLGTGVGSDIAHRAEQMGQELRGIGNRVDANDCNQQWWSEEPESEAELEARLASLWRQVVEEESDDSCVLVTHSNLIKALVMRFGGLDEEEEQPITVDEAYLTASSSSVPLPATGKGVGLGDAVLEDSLVATSPRSPSTCQAGVDDASTASSPSAAAAGAAARWLPPCAAGGRERDRFLSAASNEFEDCCENFVDEPLEALVDCRLDFSTKCWQVVNGGPDALRRLKVDRLQNCGVLGLRCVLETPARRQELNEVDGWIDVDSVQDPGVHRGPGAFESRWVAKDALLMFDSILVN